MLLTLKCSHVKLYIGRLSVEVWHLQRLVTFELKFPGSGLFDLFLHFAEFIDRWAGLRGQNKPLFGIIFVISFDCIDGGLASLLLVSFKVL